MAKRRRKSSPMISDPKRLSDYDPNDLELQRQINELRVELDYERREHDRLSTQLEKLGVDTDKNSVFRVKVNSTVATVLTITGLALAVASLVVSFLL